MSQKTALFFAIFFLVILLSSFYLFIKIPQPPLSILKIKPTPEGTVLSFVFEGGDRPKFEKLAQKAQVPLDFSQSFMVGLDSQTFERLKSLGEIKIEVVPEENGVSFNLKKNLSGKQGDVYLTSNFLPQNTLLYFSSDQHAPLLLKTISQNWPEELQKFLDQIYTQTSNFSLGIFPLEEKPVYALVAQVENQQVTSQELANFSSLAAEIKKHISEDEGIAVGFKESMLGKVKTYTLTLPRGFSEEFKTSDLIVSLGIFENNLVLASSEQALEVIGEVISKKRKSLSWDKKEKGILGFLLFNPPEFLNEDFLSQTPLGKIKLGQKDLENYFKEVSQIEILATEAGIKGQIKLR